MQTESNNADKSVVIDQITQSNLLDYNKIEEVLLCDKLDGKTWQEHAKNFRE